MGRKNILLTGPPRCGKSTLIETVIQKIDRPMTGFFTREIKEGGKRVGFSIITLDGKEGTLAHKDSETKIRVGKYGVHLDQLDQMAVPSITPSRPEEIIIIDEIGKMECLSSLFRKTLLKTLDSNNWVVGSIALKGSPFIERIKERRDVALFTVTEKNRVSLVGEILGHIQDKNPPG
jgi:nucleoside-triphosphatase